MQCVNVVHGISVGRGVEVVHGVTKCNALKWCMVFQWGVQCGSMCGSVAMMVSVTAVHCDVKRCTGYLSSQLC